MRLTILVFTYNQESYVAQALDSVDGGSDKKERNRLR